MNPYLLNWLPLIFIHTMVAAFSFVFYIYPNWQEKIALQVTAKTLTTRLIQNELKPESIKTQLNNNPTLAVLWHELMHLIHISGLTLVKLHDSTDEKQRLTVTATGSFNHLRLLFENLTRAPFLMDEFNFHKGILHGNFLIKNKNTTLPDKMLTLNDVADPMCRGEGVFTQEEANVAEVTLNEIQMVGYVKENRHWHAIIDTGNQLIAVNVNDKLGKEKGRIISISPQQIQLQIDNTIQFIKLKA